MTTKTKTKRKPAKERKTLSCYQVLAAVALLGACDEGMKWFIDQHFEQATVGQLFLGNADNSRKLRADRKIGVAHHCNYFWLIHRLVRAGFYPVPKYWGTGTTEYARRYSYANYGNITFKKFEDALRLVLKKGAADAQR